VDLRERERGVVGGNYYYIQWRERERGVSGDDRFIIEGHGGWHYIVT